MAEPPETPPNDPRGRLLHLLSLLQMRPSWSGAELAGRLGVTGRTVRRDIDHLRNLGYPVDASPGPAGGYSLGHGGAMPPLLLDDDEATAVTIALRTAAGGPVTGIEEAALSALSKLDRVLPPQLRARVEALRAVTLYVGGRATEVDPDLLVIAAHASATGERLRLTYRDRLDRLTERRIEPFRLVCTGRRWYLVARDVDQTSDDAGGWRTFRVDRVVDLANTGHRFRLDDPPDAASLVSRAVSSAPYRYTARVRFAIAADQLRAVFPAAVGEVEADGTSHSILSTGANDVDRLAAHLVATGLEFEVVDPPELRAHLETIGARLAAVHRSGSRAPRRTSQ